MMYAGSKNLLVQAADLTKVNVSFIFSHEPFLHFVSYHPNILVFITVDVI